MEITHRPQSISQPQQGRTVAPAKRSQEDRAETQQADFKRTSEQRAVQEQVQSRNLQQQQAFENAAVNRRLDGRLVRVANRRDDIQDLAQARSDLMRAKVAQAYELNQSNSTVIDVLPESISSGSSPTRTYENVSAMQASNVSVDSQPRAQSAIDLVI